MNEQSSHKSQPKAMATKLLAGSTLLLSPLALAHHPMGGQTPETLMQGLLSGFGHPVIGVDHFAFLMVVALLAFTIPGRARYLLPLAFVGATVLGTLYHLGAADLPFTEVVIALSVLLGGLTVLFKFSLPALMLGALVALFGVFHGYAYGEAIVGAEQTPMLAYLVGFSAIQYALIAGATWMFSQLAKRSMVTQSRLMRSGGVLATAVGSVFLALGLA